MDRNDSGQEAELQRWADDGGRNPDATPGRVRRANVPRPPWAAVGIAAGLGFVLGWLSAPHGDMTDR